MALKRIFATLPSIAKLASPAPARRILTQPQRHVPVSLLPITTRLAHSIPRPRNPAPFKQDPQPAQLSSTTQEQEKQSSPPSIASSQPTQPPSQPQQQQPQQPGPNILQHPHYELTFTCRPCGTRSRHRVSKQGYHHGTVLIACPGCKNRHVISDHLRIFGDTATTIEDILREKGELVKKGMLGEEGDLEFWEDGSTTEREPWVEREVKREGGEGEEDLPPGATFKSVRAGEKKEE